MVVVKNLFKNLKFSWQYVRNDKKYLFIIAFVHIIDIVLNVISPILSAKIIIELTSNNFKRKLTACFTSGSLFIEVLIFSSSDKQTDGITIFSKSSKILLLASEFIQCKNLYARKSKI